MASGISLRLGWGYLGTSGHVKNPLCSASDRFCYRDNSYKQAEESIDGSQMFHGPASLLAASNGNALATAAPETGV
ncbi:YjbH domain-containing protein [Escherichia coli]